MNNILGIMTHRIHHPNSFRRHARAALAENFSGVIVYTPQGVNLKTGQIHGHVFRDGTWSRQRASYPKINLDIGFYPESSLRKASLVKKSKQLRFTAYGLGNKCKIQSHLVRSSFLQPYLLPTEQVKTAQEFIQFLKAHRSIMLKPINGWGGKGIIRVTLDKSHFIVQQNGMPALTLPLSSQGPYIRKVLRNGRHLMQKWIDIRNRSGRVFDIRALVQKNGEGNWQTTGTAVREGKQGKITSNIKSGGSAHQVSDYLKKEFDNERGEALTNSVAEIAQYIPPFMEKSYHTRLSELGIDLAIDTNGRLWLLEVNIKPGRMVMLQVYGKKAWERSFRVPFQNARRILDKNSK
ncbi:YheC/YheD family endospore coat-associated protein [Paenibacillus sp. UNC451MF]|uniref:YheC/YheD family endospore coat-associated protein n=1 Tax=Paenibacillus sp. UNC451MF TaxID=1449063 RepID=UPI00048EEC73|nr:YheC/YheD family protein [Paenibacillus sp. UNC451MF]